MNDTSSPVALVTGGGTGVGRAVCLRLAEQGCDSVINYSRSKKEAEDTVAEVKAAGAEAIAHHCDVANDQGVREMIDRTRDRFGRLDFVINNAGMTHFIDHTDLDAVTEEIWDEIFAVNLKGAFFVSRAAMPMLRESKEGSIVNVASIAGIYGLGSSIPYCASKGAMITMTKSFARAFAPQVRVNAVCPGVILTRWMEKHEEMVLRGLAMTPLDRLCTAEDVAQTIVFLLREATMMTGQAVNVDGGVII